LLRSGQGKDEDKLVSFESVLVQCGLVAPVDIPNLLWRNSWRYGNSRATCWARFHCKIYSDFFWLC